MGFSPKKQDEIFERMSYHYIFALYATKQAHKAQQETSSLRRKVLRYVCNDKRLQAFRNGRPVFLLHPLGAINL
jgi:hypothetical protein